MSISSSKRHNRLSGVVNEFADDLTDLFNGSITDGIPITPYVAWEGFGYVGYQITASNKKGLPIPIRLHGAEGDFQMWIMYTLDLDDDEESLLIVKSGFVLEFVDGELIKRYEFDLDNPNEYPNPHLHIGGNSDVADRLLKLIGRLKDKFEDFHIAVGGELDEPTPAVIIQFLFSEDVTPVKSTCQDAINTFRNKYRDLKVKAVVRRHSDLARKELKRIGYFA